MHVIQEDGLLGPMKHSWYFFFKIHDYLKSDKLQAPDSENTLLSLLMTFSDTSEFLPRLG